MYNDIYRRDGFTKNLCIHVRIFVNLFLPGMSARDRFLCHAKMQRRKAAARKVDAKKNANGISKKLSFYVKVN